MKIAYNDTFQNNIGTNRILSLPQKRLSYPTFGSDSD